MEVKVVGHLIIEGKSIGEEMIHWLLAIWKTFSCALTKLNILDGSQLVLIKWGGGRVTAYVTKYMN
jgi:hypothetical protein